MGLGINMVVSLIVMIISLITNRNDCLLVSAIWNTVNIFVAQLPEKK